MTVVVVFFFITFTCTCHSATIQTQNKVLQIQFPAISKQETIFHISSVPWYSLPSSFSKKYQEHQNNTVKAPSFRATNQNCYERKISVRYHKCISYCKKNDNLHNNTYFLRKLWDILKMGDTVYQMQSIWNTEQVKKSIYMAVRRGILTQFLNSSRI